MRVAHLAVQLGLGHQGSHRIHDQHINGAGLDQRLSDLERLFAGVGLRDEQVVHIDAKLFGVAGIERVFGVDEGRQATRALGFRDDLQGDGGFAGGLRTVDLCNTAARNTPNAKSGVKADGAGGDDGDRQQRFFRPEPDDPIWPNRDRFVLSNGHASMLLYSLLHLAGVREVSADGKILSTPALSLDEIKNFRQIGSKTPGHPEYGLTTGVETTTGPLGQGVANSVGMAIAERWLAEYFNRPGFELFNYNVWAICGDGDMMEGISSEAASVAGHLKLSNLCWIYDNNHITIEGNTDLAFDENVAARFASYGWDVQHVGDANDLVALADAYTHALSIRDRPKLIIVNSHIGYGSPHRQDTREAHGEALGEEEVKLTKRAYGWPEDAKFLVPDGVRENFRDVIDRKST